MEMYEELFSEEKLTYIYLNFGHEKMSNITNY